MNIKTNSKDVNNNDIFIALPGINNDGHNYICDAINNGAEYIICEKGSYNKPYMIVESTKNFLNEFLSSNFGDLINSMIIIGITGTNGKTTSCFLIYDLLKKLNIKSAYIGTLGFYIEDKISDLNNTTPDILTLYNLLIDCKKYNVKIVVMEVSSHSLELDRVYGIKFDYVVFTNLTQDHLDYHLNMDNYLNSKKKLFLNNINSIGITNVDDKYGNEFKTNNTITYGFNSNDYKILDYRLYLNKVIYKFKYNI